MSDLKKRNMPLQIDSSDFRKIGTELVNEIADFLEKIDSCPVTSGESSDAIKELFESQAKIPTNGTEPQKLLQQTTELLKQHSLFNSHPAFMGYITAPASPIGILGDFLASAINQNVGGRVLSPVATEIELQTIRWIAEFIGYHSDCGGILVSGGNMANFVGIVAARRAKADNDIRIEGMHSGTASKMTIYTSVETHTWVQKAADLFGFGNNMVRSIQVDNQQRMDVDALRKSINADVQNGFKPSIVSATAGTVSTGAVDPLEQIASVCKEFDLWFHVDGAYGAFAAGLQHDDNEINSISKADSIALDPHKWLYAPLDAGCTLIKNKQFLLDAFSYSPPYYHIDNKETNFFEYGFENSRSFRALKVWLAIRHAGAEGYRQMIRDDINLARELFELVKKNDLLEVKTTSLSITTFRFVPEDLQNKTKDTKVLEYLNRLNSSLLEEIETGGETFISNAIIKDEFCLRACIVNFRTTVKEINALPKIVTRIGKKLDNNIRSEFF